jgi:Ca2+/H+ antiporter, TMEM165/GDT1 family
MGFLRPVPERNPVYAFLLSTAVVFVAELGDKSQLLVLAFATRYQALPILAGVGVAAGLLYAVSVGVGAALQSALPTGPLTIAAGIAFLGFALWTWLVVEDDADHDAAALRDTRSRRQAAFTAGGAFFVAELGDKTMLATVGLATTEHLAGVWLGATLGMLAAASIAILVGRHLGRRLPERALRLGAAVAFALFGVALLVEGITG